MCPGHCARERGHQLKDCQESFLPLAYATAACCLRTSSPVYQTTTSIPRTTRLLPELVRLCGCCSDIQVFRRKFQFCCAHSQMIKHGLEAPPPLQTSGQLSQSPRSAVSILPPITQQWLANFTGWTAQSMPSQTTASARLPQAAAHGFPMPSTTGVERR